MEENMNTGQGNQSPNNRRIKSTEAPQPPPPPPPPPTPPQKCPRCDSTNTKFCYFNNYSLSQPRYLCKNCRRYWTHGGSLRNVPVGGGSRKNKRSKASASGSSSVSSEMAQAVQALPILARPPNFPVIDQVQVARPRFFAGGTILSSFTGMQTLTTGLNPQAPGVGLNAGSGVGRYGANMGLVQFRASNNAFFPSHQHQGLAPTAIQGLAPTAIQGLAPTAMSSWTHQGFVSRGGGGGNGGGQVSGASFSANQWSSDVTTQGYPNPHQ